jgi:hypothetical protein
LVISQGFPDFDPSSELIDAAKREETLAAAGSRLLRLKEKG